MSDAPGVGVVGEAILGATVARLGCCDGYASGDDKVGIILGKLSVWMVFEMELKMVVNLAQEKYSLLQASLSLLKLERIAFQCPYLQCPTDRESCFPNTKAFGLANLHKYAPFREPPLQLRHLDQL